MLSRTKRWRECFGLTHFVFFCFFFPFVALLYSVCQPMRHTYQLPTQFFHPNGPLRWLPSRLVGHYVLRALQQQQHNLQPAAAIPAAATPFAIDVSSEGAKMNRLAGAATKAVLIPDSTTTHESKRRCNFRSEDVPCLGQLPRYFDRRFRSD